MTGAADCRGCEAQLRYHELSASWCKASSKYSLLVRKGTVETVPLILMYNFKARAAGGVFEGKRCRVSGTLETSQDSIKHTAVPALWFTTMQQRGGDQVHQDQHIGADGAEFPRCDLHVGLFFWCWMFMPQSQELIQPNR